MRDIISRVVFCAESKSGLCFFPARQFLRFFKLTFFSKNDKLYPVNTVNSINSVNIKNIVNFKGAYSVKNFEKCIFSIILYIKVEHLENVENDFHLKSSPNFQNLIFFQNPSFRYYTKSFTNEIVLMF